MPPLVPGLRGRETVAGGQDEFDTGRAPADNGNVAWTLRCLGTRQKFLPLRRELRNGLHEQRVI